jgi:hypothetical protein
MSVHKKCIPKVTKNCRGLVMQINSPDDDDSTRETTDDLAVGGRLRDLSASPINLPENDEDENESSSSSLFARHGNVRAQRLIQSIKRVKKASGGALFWEGWMVHTTDKEPLTEKRYYWRVDASYVSYKT